MTLKDMNIVPLGLPSSLSRSRMAPSTPVASGAAVYTAQMAGTVALDTADVGDGSGAITTFVFFGTKFMHDRPQVALAFLRALVRGARDAQGSYLKDPKIAASIAQQTGLKVDAVEAQHPLCIDPNLDIARFEDSLRDQERSTARTASSIITGDLDFKRRDRSSLVHEAAASVK